jgi:hypothetical protein
MDWMCGSSGRAHASQTRSPELKKKNYSKIHITKMKHFSKIWCCVSMIPATQAAEARESQV